MDLKETLRVMPDRVTEQFIKDTSMSLYDSLYSNARNYGSDIALEFYRKPLSYDGLFQNIEKVACSLKSFGIQKGDVVIVSLPCIPEGIFLLYAINKLGAIYCAMDCRASEKEVEDTLKNTNAKICFVSNFHMPAFAQVAKVPIVSIAPDTFLGPSTNVRVRLAEVFTGRQRFWKMNKQIMSWGEFIHKATVQSVESVPSDGNDICAYIYTSGTTAGRKCVIITNYNLLSAVYQQIEGNAPHKRGDVFINLLPLFSCYGLAHGIHQPLKQGIHIVLIPLFHPKNLETLLKRHKPNYIITVPSHWDIYLKKGNPKYMASFDSVIVGGDTITEAFETKMKEFLRISGSKAELLNGYGMTEASACCTGWMGGVKSGSIGKPFSMIIIDIIDPDTDEILPIGEVGEICLTAPNICLGYLNDPEGTAKILRTHKDGITRLHTGDIGYLDSDNELYFCDRSKRMYVRYDGTKISPKDIENVLNICPEIQRSLVVAIDDPVYSHGKVAKAYVVPADGISDETCLDAVKKYAAKNIDEYKRPVSFEAVKELPKKASGKIDYMINSNEQSGN